MEPSKIHTKIGDKEFSSEEYVNWLHDAPKQLRDAYQAKIGSGKKIEEVGREIIAEVIKDAKNIQINSTDDEVIRDGKTKLLRLVESIKQQCQISGESVSTIIYDYNGKNREVIEIESVKKDATERKPIIEIAKPAFEEIETQESAIMDIVKDYAFEVENLLIIMKGRYDDEKNPRLKELLKKELFVVQADILSRIEKDLDSIEDSEYMQIAGAKADLLAVKDGILKMTDGISSENEEKIAV